MDLVCSGKSSISNLLRETMGRFKLGTQFRVSLVELKKAMSMARLVSLFPLLFFLFLFLQSSKANLSAYFFSFYGFRAIDRNLVFLVCNGILVIIVKISRTSSSENHWHNHEQISKIQDDDQPELSVTKTECLACHLGDEQLENKIEQEEEEQQNTENGYFLIAKKGESDLLVAHFEEERQRKGFEEEEGGFVLLSTDEFNKTCEDFIRKVKERIKSERMIRI